MNLLDLAVKITCDDQASGKVDSIGDGIKNKLAAAAKVGVAAVAAVGTATVAIGKTALDAYSNYEQLVGGIDTLFKASSGKMQQYAANAYQTAGVSANRYMEISTSFAAALISSLGGNTEAAADMANTAITDMSDNANKMGTSLETVQEAYMSLSRGNYEMLDSLKLGYGGTKSELERLLSDAEKFSAAQGEVRDFSVDSYSDIVEAIHIVQDEMGITGTTANEAATTIEGSVNMAKAAWANWITELGKDDADMEARTNELVNSVATAASNIVPRVAQIISTGISTLPGIITTVGPVFISSLMTIVESAASTLQSVIPADLGGAIVSGIEGAFSTIASVAGQVIPIVVSGIITAIPQIASAASQLIADFGMYLSENLPTIMEQGLQLVTQLSQSILDNLPVLAQGAANLLVGFAQGIAGSLPTIIEQGPVIIQNLADAINNSVPILIGGGLQAIVALGQGIIQAIPTLIANIPQIFSAFLAAWSALNWLDLGRNAITFLGNGITGMIGFIGSCGTNVMSAISGAIQNLPSTLANIGSNGISSLGSAISGAVGFVTSAAANVGSSIMGALASIPGSVVSIGSQIVHGIANGISSAAGVVVDKIAGVVGGAINAAKNLLGIHSPSRVFREIGRYTMQGAALGVDDDADLLLQSTDNAMRGMVDTAQSVATGDALSASASQSGIIEWLADNLPAIISQYTPVIGQKEFGRMTRKAVAYA